MLNVLTRRCDLKKCTLNQWKAQKSSVKCCCEHVVCHHQLLRHVDPRHMSAWPNKFTEGIAVSAGAAAEVQDPAALELRWKGKTTAEEPGEKDNMDNMRMMFTEAFSAICVCF